jgi:hypothetical protein
MGYQFTPGTPRYNGAATAGQHLTIGLDFYTITTKVNILQQAVGAFADVADLTEAQAGAAAYANASEFVAGTIPGDFSQDALDRLVEIVSQNGQPVIMGTPSVSGGTYTFTFAVEHKSAWGITATASPQAVPALANAIVAGGIDFGFGVSPDVLTTSVKSGL